MRELLLQALMETRIDELDKLYWILEEVRRNQNGSSNIGTTERKAV